MNAEGLTTDALQTLMQHQDDTTTQRYLNKARQLNTTMADQHVPDVSRSKAR